MGNTFSGYLGNDNILYCKVVDAAGAVDATAEATAVIVADAAPATTVETVTLTYSADRTRHEAVPDESLWTRNAYYTATITVVGTNDEDGQIIVKWKAKQRIASE